MAESPSELHAEIEKLERKHAEHPEGRYFVPLANAYRKLGDLENAETLLREGLRRHPDYLSAHIVLGRCLADRSATRDAGEEFRYVLSLDPQNLIALRTLGELAVADGQTAEAERWYDELLAVDPMNEEARRALESIRGVAASPATEEEFHPGAPWWERDPDPAPALQPLSVETNVSGGEESLGEEGGEGEAVEEIFSAGFLTLDEAPAPIAGLEAFEPIAELPLDDELPILGLTDRPEAPSPFENAEGDELEEEPAEDESFDDSEPVEVVTETIAELYARQGFHERAAEVLRELIRRRGGDVVLERRLAEIEAMMSGAVEPTPESEIPNEPELEAVDSFATSFSDGFTPAAPLVAADSRESIGVYLRTLIAWVPAAESLPSITEMEWQPEPQPAPTLASPGTGSAEADLFPWEQPGAALSAPAPELPPAALPDPLPGWSAEPAPEESETAPIGGVDEEFFSFDTFFSDAPEPSLEREAIVSGIEDTIVAEPLVEEPAVEATPPPPPSAPVTSASPAPVTVEDEDDLESFQAWLRGLKK